MRKSLLRAISFGGTSGVITTLGLISGLNAATSSRGVVLGGIVSVAIADSLSDALGIHVSEEASSKDSESVWAATLATFLLKFLVTLTFAIPVLLLKLPVALTVNIAWGFFILISLSFSLARKNDQNGIYAALEHSLIAIVVLAATQIAGGFFRTP